MTYSLIYGAVSIGEINIYLPRCKLYKVWFERVEGAVNIVTSYDIVPLWIFIFSRRESQYDGFNNLRDTQSYNRPSHKSAHLLREAPGIIANNSER